MTSYLLPSLKLSFLLLLICSGIYPLVISGIATLSPGGGNGQTILSNERIVGYENIGQAFTSARYFSGRPSAVDYNAAGSGGSNKGPSNEDYLAQVEARIDSFLKYNPGTERSEIPADLVTASGSGLDPHISVQAALVQARRVAKARNLSEEQVKKWIAESTEKPLLGLFGPEKVHVLKLNIALDKRSNQPEPTETIK